MDHISYYTKSAIEERMSNNASVASHYDLTQYERQTEYGVDRINCFMDSTKAIPFMGGVALIPAIFYPIGGQEGGAETVYFDASSGQRISYVQAEENRKRNMLAEGLDRDGQELMKQKRYGDAYEKFSQAYNMCTSGYSEKERLRNNIDTAKNKWAYELNEEGRVLDTERKDDEALSKYRQAAELSTSEKNRKIYQNNQAIMLLRIGSKLQNAGSLKEAILKYEEALSKAVKEDILQSVKTALLTATEKLLKNKQADILDREGSVFSMQQRFKEAYEKFNQAFNICSKGYCEEERFKTNRDIAKNNWAAQLNDEGRALDAQHRNEEALKKYRLATELTTKPESKIIYQNNHAVMLLRIGNDLQNAGRIKDSIKMYEEALNKAIKESTLNSINESLKIANEKDQKNRAADSLNSEGNEFVKEKKYKEAYEKFSEAYNLCSSGYIEETTFKINRDTAKSNWADQVNDEGRTLSRQNSNVEALEKYKEAAELTNNSNDKLTFLNNQAIVLQKLGNNYQNTGNHREAMSYYSKALKKATKDSTIDSIKESIVLAQEKEHFNEDAITLNNEGKLLEEEEKYEEALEKYKQATELTTKDFDRSTFGNNQAGILLKLGNNLHDSGKFMEAISIYDEALSKAFKEDLIESIQESLTVAQAKLQQNEEADRLDMEGIELQKLDKHQEAYEKFDLAAKTCVSGYSEEGRFKLSRDFAKNRWADQINQEAKVLSQQNRNEEALAKYKEAAEITVHSEDRKTFINNQALALLRIGSSYKSAGNITEAIAKYEEALAIATKETTIINIRETIAMEQENERRNEQAFQLNEEGKALSKQNKNEEALVKIREAAEVAVKTESKNSYRNNQAIILQMLGNALQTAGDYKGAIEKYNEGLRAAVKDSTTNNIRKSLTAAQEKDQKFEELSRLDTEGNELYRAKKYKDAFEAFEQIVTMNVSGFSEEAKSKQEDVKNAWANQLNEEGKALEQQDKFEEAIVKYQEAADTTLNSDNKNTFLNNQALVLQKIGDTLQRSSSFKDAISKYREALTKATKEDTISKINESINAARDKGRKNREADEHNEIGNAFFADGKYEDAFEEYSSACDKSSSDYVEKPKFKANMEKAKSKMNAARVRFNFNDINIDKPRLNRIGTGYTEFNAFNDLKYYYD